MGQMSPRAQIRHELHRAQGNLVSFEHHITRAAWWTNEGGHPELAAYLEQFAKGGLMLQDAIEKFLRDVMGTK